MKYLILTGIICLSIFSAPAQNQECIKFNYPLQGNEILLTFKSPTDDLFYGYISGNNIAEDLAKANFFKFSSDYKYLKGIYFDFGKVTNTNNSQVEFAVWDVSKNKPGKKLDSVFISLKKIKSDADKKNKTFIQFKKPILLKGNYFAGVILPQLPGDTVALKSNSNGNTSPGIAWEQWLDKTWHAYSEYNCWSINIANAIFPLLCQNESSVNISRPNYINSFQVYPNPASSLLYINSDIPTSIRIYNSQGILVYEGLIKTNDKINIVNLPNGIYYIGTNHAKNISGLKFIKQ